MNLESLCDVATLHLAMNMLCSCLIVCPSDFRPRRTLRPCCAGKKAGSSAAAKKAAAPAKKGAAPASGTEVNESTEPQQQQQGQQTGQQQQKQPAGPNTLSLNVILKDVIRKPGDAERLLQAGLPLGMVVTWRTVGF